MGSPWVIGNIPSHRHRRPHWHVLPLCFLICDMITCSDWHVQYYHQPYSPEVESRGCPVLSVKLQTELNKIFSLQKLIYPVVLL